MLGFIPGIQKTKNKVKKFLWQVSWIIGTSPIMTKEIEFSFGQLSDHKKR
jgi:hypothetical protein